jgi:8-oxo-dGTP diphosphatase
MVRLESTNNRYGGTIVSPENIPSDNGEFERILAHSLDYWRENGIKVVWFKVPTHRVELLPLLYQSGFENHHCNPDVITLTKRLQADALVPHYAKHTIGVGGLVINRRNELLTIREQAHIKNHPHNWKFPGGMLDPSEHFEDGVKREVFEETGIETEFLNFIGFRHHHLGQFETSNIYAVCRLNPLTETIRIQESEIFDARWFPIDDYLADEKIGKYNQYILKSALQFPGLKSIKLPSYMNSDNEYEVFIAHGMR